MSCVLPWRPRELGPVPSDDVTRRASSEGQSDATRGPCRREHSHFELLVLRWTLFSEGQQRPSSGESHTHEDLPSGGDPESSQAGDWAVPQSVPPTPRQDSALRTACDLTNPLPGQCPGLASLQPHCLSNDVCFLGHVYCPELA